jgi:hypothetical protein
MMQIRKGVKCKCRLFMELLRNRLVSVCLWGGGGATPLFPLPLVSSVTIHAKTTVHCSPDSSMHSNVVNDDTSLGLLFFVLSMVEMEREEWFSKYGLARY